VSLFLVLPNQHGQVLAEAAVAAATLAVAAASVALLVAALAPRQLSTVVAFQEHRLSAAAADTLPAEVLADQVSHLDSIMVVIACLPCGRRDSPAQSLRPRDRMSTGPPQRLGNQTA
jgi:hypothetical protein